MTYILIAKNLANVSHLEMVLSYAYYLCSKGHYVELSCSFYHSIGGKVVIDKNIFKKYILPPQVKLRSIENIKYDMPNVILCNFGFIGIQNIKEALRYKNFRYFVQMDEGSGSWQNFWTLLSIGIEERKNYNKPWLLYSIKKIISMLVGKIQYHRVKEWKWIKNGKPNKNLITYLVKVYQSKYLESPLPYCKEETWVILTGGFVESGYVSSKEYVSWLQKVIKKISTNNNTILLKAHPAEDLLKYQPLLKDVDIVEAKESIDSLLADKKYHHYKVIGEYSTSLVTLNMLYGIETYTIPSLVYRKLTGQFKVLFHKHVKPFTDITL